MKIPPKGTKIPQKVLVMMPNVPEKHKFLYSLTSTPFCASKIRQFAQLFCFKKPMKPVRLLTLCDRGQLKTSSVSPAQSSRLPVFLPCFLHLPSPDARTNPPAPPLPKSMSDRRRSSMRRLFPMPLRAIRSSIRSGPKQSGISCSHRQIRREPPPLFVWR